ncbi:HET-domain-containing protein [Acephala macrosclerotiorum]|nr:HET-domain-containing protein [Acephala macrosclerotiorum]
MGDEVLYAAISPLLEKDVNSRQFLPKGHLEALMNAEKVDLELESSCFTAADGQDAKEILRNFILGRATKCFATLVRIGKVNEIRSFHQNGLTDAYLPLEFKVHKGKCLAANSVEPSSQLDPGPVEKTFKDLWRIRDIEEFEQKQWLFLAPVFTEEDRDWKRCFHDSCPLPFLSPPPGRQQDPQETLFSQVRKVALHASHIIGFNQDPTNQNNLLVAIKQLKSTTDVQTSLTQATNPDIAEADSLNTIRKLDHRHVIKAIAVFEWCKHQYFIFPWADNGNLREFWEKWKGLDSIYWVLEQLDGLCDALYQLHYRNWRHGDLKPENLLCFKDSKSSRDILVIADVGLLKVHSILTPNRTNPTRTMTGTRMYCPPGDRRSPRSRLYDIWSMGAIILEMLICLMYGPQEVQRLHTLIDRFYVDEGTRSDSSNARIHPEVERWIQHIYQDPRSGTDLEPTAIRLLLNLVRDRLLVVRIPHDHTTNPTQSLIEQIIPEMDTSMSDVQSGIPELRVEYAVQYDDSDSSYIPSINFPGQEATAYRADSKELSETVHTILGNSRSSGSTKLPLFTLVYPDYHFAGPRTKHGDFLTEQHARAAGHHSSYGPQAAQVHTEIAQDLKSSRDWWQILVFTDTYVPWPIQILDDVWKSTPDNQLARTIFNGIDTNAVLPSPEQGTSKLCQRCSHVNPWVDGFQLKDDLPGLQDKAESCGLCKMLVPCLIKFGINKRETVQLFTAESSFTLHSPTGPKILSIYAFPKDAGTDRRRSSLQFGFPKLPEAGSETHFRVLREWLQACDGDASHTCHSRAQGFLPTRVLDVGSQKNSNHLRLHCHNRNIRTPGKYIALSHRWGDPKHHRQFSTTRSNISDFEKSISYERLPKTFQDAITVTRNLGVQFLWIDSLCIVQDDPEDWKIESGRMESVFSAAYCTIAATCANGSSDGFLKVRPTRAFVTMQIDRLPEIYICEAIDDFQGDVEESELQKRGWVLQERALANRTIHYTEKQSYWECGGGVRSETMTRMSNLKASFLGDADFPNSAEKYVKGGRIRLYEDLYERYSKLNFTMIEDRPVAISGLEKRLLRTFNTAGACGIFECYFHRGLLWKRLNDPLKRIKSIRGQKVPSWSWMGYAGAINYMDIPGGKAEWSESVQSPFSGEGSSSTCVNESGATALMLRAVARDFVKGRGDLIFDEPGRLFEGKLRCVIVGKTKDKATKDLGLHPKFEATPPDNSKDGNNHLLEYKKHYVLVIVETGRIESQVIYERVAVGTMEGRDVLPTTSDEIVLIR